MLQQFTDIPASVGNKSRKSLSPLYVRNSGARPGEAALQFIPPCRFVRPQIGSLFQKSDLCCASNPRFNSSLDQDTTERAEWCDGEPRDAVKIPGSQSPRFRSSPSNVGEMSVLSCTDRRGKGGKKVFPAFGCSVD